MALALGAIGIKGGYVLAAFTLFVLPAIASSTVDLGPTWESSGRGRLALEPMLSGGSLLLNPPIPPVDRALQTTETRQLLEAKSYRRLQRGEPALDIEAELTRLLDSQNSKPSLDEKLRAEVRVLVNAHNERLMRKGQEPLNVEKEIERQLVDFIGLGK